MTNPVQQTTEDTDAPMQKVAVHIEWPTGTETVFFEIFASATDEQIHAAAADEFFNRCNFGWEKAKSDE